MLRRREKYINNGAKERQNGLNEREENIDFVRFGGARANVKTKTKTEHTYLRKEKKMRSE